MSNVIFPGGQFDPVAENMPTIGTATPRVVNGDTAKTLDFLNADRLQANLVYMGFSTTCTSENTAANTGNGGVLSSSKMGVWCPGFCTRLAVSVLASGAATITIGGSYVISLSDETGVYSMVDGSQTATLNVSNTSNGLPALNTYDLAISGAGTVTVLAWVFHFMRHQEEL